MTKRANGEGGYTKRPDGRWQYRTRVEGRRVSGSGRLQMEAKAAALARAEVVAPQRTSDTWADLFQSWVAEPAASHELRPLTKDLYAGAL
ncbi:MAG: hypothetical protein U0904_11540, partial [Candidatus Nanopelagicales bacterium]|nr:hypothetical protein [Candidatus Nanopelagicales bacterium]